MEANEVRYIEDATDHLTKKVKKAISYQVKGEPKRLTMRPASWTIPAMDTGLCDHYTAAAIDANGKHLGNGRKHHIPHCHPGFWGKFYFKRGNPGYPEEVGK